MGIGLGLCCCEEGCCFRFVEGLTTSQSATIELSGGTGGGAQFNGSWLLPFTGTLSFLDLFGVNLDANTFISVAASCDPTDYYQVTLRDGSGLNQVIQWRCGLDTPEAPDPADRCDFFMFNDGLGAGYNTITIDSLQFAQA